MDSRVPIRVFQRLPIGPGAERTRIRADQREYFPALWRGGVERAEAVARIKAAVDAHDEDADILILGRTDAAATMGLEEGL